MLSPAVLGTRGAAAASSHLVGALVVTVAVVALSEVARPARLLNLPLAAWVIVAPWAMSHTTSADMWSGLVSGALLLVLSLPRGPIHERYGGWDRVLAWPHAPPRPTPATSER